jgi:hypothetical protein
MAWKHYAWRQLTGMLFGGVLVMAQGLAHPHGSTPSAAPEVHVTVEEILSYDCARSIASIVKSSEPLGPLFSQGQLVFTSIEAADASNILLVNAGYGNFSVALEGAGINRIRFEVPTGDNSGDPQLFFLSYMHGGVLRSRYFEYSEGHAPAGHDDLDYLLVHPQRAENLLPHLDYAIHETAEATLAAITDGKVPRSELSRHRIANCENISRQSPNLARQLRHNLDMLDMIVMGPWPTSPTAPASVVSNNGGGGRMPASLK